MRRTLALVLVIAAAVIAVPRPQTTAAQTTIIVITIVGPTTTTYGLPGGGSASASMASGTGTFGNGNFATGRGSVMIIETITVRLIVGPGSSGSLSGGAGGGGGSGGGGGGGGGQPPGGGGSGGDTAVDKFKGALRAAMKAASGDQANKKFTVKNAAWASSVRGTEFTVEARTRWMRVRTYEGAVDLTNLKTNARVTVPAGLESVGRDPAPPTRPAPFKFPAQPFWE